MKLTAKIRAEYLDQILKGKKRFEYRQLESITLTDELGRKVSCRIEGITPLSPRYNKKIRAKYPHVPWDDNLRIYEIAIKPILSQS